VAAVVALVVFCPLAGARMPAKPHHRPLLWGARIGQQFTGAEAPWDWSAVTEFQARNAGGTHLRVLHWSSPWQNPYTGATYRFSTPTFQRVRRHHVVSFFDWANSGISDAEVAAGNWDAYIRSWASAARAWGNPFFLRFDWEMNASWFSWGVGANGNTAADFVAAWRHVHDIFAAVGATNVRWVWCPNVDPHHKFADIADLYPGNSYVDWTCLDGYNGDDPWTSFTNLFASSYTRILHLAPTKPMIVGEVGSTESGGSKARWIKAMFAALPTRFPRVHGLLWFDKYAKGPGGHSDWPLETSRSASRAFTDGIRSEDTGHSRRRRAG
jgi:hypothetical protein